ncbi:hypothetical protein [Rhodococcus oryzae]|jgi:hypothetical protein|uniref:hypothetical protein n=1 Tax=Rhodococcus oryzae TaxID=2571143 RepID=UPI0037935DC4
MATDTAFPEPRAKARADDSPTAGAAVAKRTRTVAVRLTEEEEATWLAAAFTDGRRQLGAWVRERAVAGYLGKVRLKASAGGGLSPEAVAEITAWRQELLRWGNNLNQISKAMNAGKSSPAIEKYLRDNWGKHEQTLARMADRLDELEKQN